ncbi:MAG: sigma 54-interacting transcriptional regulator [Deltaproteobacteria bacterium]|nr:sigma 54-interacting transcriptional regulator [Deltaproteobacteria bacterium]
MATRPEEVATDALPRAGGRRLVAVWHDGSRAVELPPRGALVIGRGDSCDLVVAHTSVSRRHVKIHVGDTLSVEDLSSSNGTWVDGVRLEPGSVVELRPGALLECGAVLVVVQGPVTERGASLPNDVVCADEAMLGVYELVDVVAKSSMSVVLMGETGVGKEIIATRVHQQSPRANAPFLKVNCAALVESLLEAEVFGYERGAFTGATQAKAGLLEGASGGTLFLDEIGELPLPTQAKLLRVLESGEVMRIGSLKPRKIDVRFVSATNRDLRELCAAGRFRQDLFFRLDGVSVYIPPLRERRREIHELASRFVDDACRQHGKARLELSGDAMAALLQHTWPGNVRELKNVINRSALLARGPTITKADLRFEPLNSGHVALRASGAINVPAAPPVMSAPPAMSGAPTLPPPPPTPYAPAGASGAPGLDAEERDRILSALEACGGNQTRAAKMLGISRRTLLNRLDLMDVRRPRK